MTLAIVGGVGVAGYLLYRQFAPPAAPAYIPGAPPPSKPGFLELVFGTTQTLLNNKLAGDAKAAYDAKVAAWKKASASYSVAYLEDGRCYSRSSGKTVNPDECIAAGAPPPPSKPAGLAGVPEAPMGLSGYGGSLRSRRYGSLG